MKILFSLLFLMGLSFSTVVFSADQNGMQGDCEKKYKDNPVEQCKCESKKSDTYSAKKGAIKPKETDSNDPNSTKH